MRQLDAIVFEGIALDRRCPTCLGDGLVYNPAWQAWHAAHDDLPPEGHPLLEQDEEVICDDCEGLGWVPTAAGTAILGLFNRYLRGAGGDSVKRLRD